MAETIKGGAYQNADGTWVNAKGKRIPPPPFAQVQPEPAPEKEPEIVVPPVTTTEDEYAEEPEPVAVEEPEKVVKPKRARKAKG